MMSRIMKHRGRSSLASAAILLVLCLIMSSCASQGAAKGDEVHAGPRMFWILEAEATGEGKGRLYAQGTLHMGRPELYPLDPETLARMAQSDIIVAELSQTELETAQALMLDRLAGSIVPEGKTLSMLLPPDELDWIRSFMGADTFAAFNRYEPWVALSALEMFAASRAGLDSALGVDASLFEEALRLGRHVEGLETAEFQMNILTGHALSDQVLMLRDSIREYRDNPDAIPGLYEAYRDDNRHLLASQIRASLDRSEAFSPRLQSFNESLLDNRNADWAQRLHGLLDSGFDVYLFAGAAHFVGEGNVIERLEAYGYTVLP